tara:strand:+ start:372 stop:599 length:228 start_codon:yes stop_codon:yes gene_type:complete
MKNLKDIIIGIFAGIGVMTLLMGNNPQSEQNGKYMFDVEYIDVIKNIHRIDTKTGVLEKWSDRTGWEVVIPRKDK